MDDYSGELASLVARKLMGGITPIGESGYDRLCLNNLKQYEELVWCFLEDIYDVSVLRTHYAGSMKDVGAEAYKFLNELKDWISEYVEDE